MELPFARSAAGAVGVGATAVVGLNTSVAAAAVVVVIVVVVAITILAFHGTPPDINWGKFSLRWSTRKDEDDAS